VPGTIDAWAVYPEIDGSVVLHVVDWKSGFGGHLRRARKADQLIHNAAALAGFGIKYDILRVEYAKIAEDGVFRDKADLSRADLLVFLDDLQDLRQSIENGPEAKPGPWCKELFCPLLGRCPGTAGAITRIDTGLTGEDYDGLQIVVDAKEFQSETHKRWQILALQAIEARAAEAWAAIKVAADEAPIDMGDERNVYRPRVKSREVLDLENPATMLVLRGMLGERADKCVEVVEKLSNKNLDKAIGEMAKVEGKKIKHVKTAVWEHLREAGVSKLSSWTEYRICKLGMGDGEDE